jgi:hypothetical protein
MERRVSRMPAIRGAMGASLVARVRSQSLRPSDLLAFVGAGAAMRSVPLFVASRKLT